MTFIEPSEKALARGFLHLQHIGVSNNVNVRQISKKLQDLDDSDFQGITNSSNVKLHIFSNILEMTCFTQRDIENLYGFIANSQSGLNYFMCVSPNDRSGNIQNFYSLWQQNHQRKNHQDNLSSIYLEVGPLNKKIWLENSNQFENYPISRFHKLFYVNL